jgi:hypothetical protein
MAPAAARPTLTAAAGCRAGARLLTVTRDTRFSLYAPSHAVLPGRERSKGEPNECVSECVDECVERWTQKGRMGIALHNADAACGIRLREYRKIRDAPKRDPVKRALLT